MSDDPGDRDKAYKVGYGKPPAHTRFKPGQSGNPSGRRKAPPSIAERFDRELRRKISVREDGKARRIEKIDLWVRSIIARAIKGDNGASRILIEMRNADEDQIARGIAEQSEDLTADEMETLERHLATVVAAAAGNDPADSG